MALEQFTYIGPDGFLTEADAAVQTSAGAGDSGKLAQLSANGKFDNSLINFSAFNNYLLVRATTTANIDLSSMPASVDGVTLSNGDRFLAKDQSTGSENGIYEFNGASSAATRAPDYDEAAEITGGDLVAATEGTANADTLWLLTTNDPITVDTTALTFTALDTSSINDGDGLSFSGSTLNVNAGNGIKFVSDAVTVEPADFAGTGLQDDGSDNMEIDFADPATEMSTSRAVAASDLSANGANQGAKILGADPATISISSATTIQGILEDIDDSIVDLQSPGVSYTVGTGGVSAGDLVFISANDEVREYATITTGARVPGLALTTEVATATVKVAANDQVLTGVLSGATAGDIYYWDGTQLTTTIPATSGAYVWKAGMAKNATDLHIEVDFIKKNV